MSELTQELVEEWRQDILSCKPPLSPEEERQWNALCNAAIASLHPVAPAGMVMDAERYRWLRGKCLVKDESGIDDDWQVQISVALPACIEDVIARVPDEQQLDKAIDAAKALDAASQPEQKGGKT